jgi:hypothetical protein
MGASPAFTSIETFTQLADELPLTEAEAPVGRRDRKDPALPPTIPGELEGIALPGMTVDWGNGSHQRTSRSSAA